MRMIFGAIGGMKFGRGNRSTRRKPTLAPLCPPQNPAWQTRSRTPDRSGGKPATNRLIYGAALFSPISSPLTTRRFTVEVFDPASTRVNVECLTEDHGKFHWRYSVSLSEIRTGASCDGSPVESTFSIRHCIGLYVCGLPQSWQPFPSTWRV
jgi:hypothetical protein